MYSYNLWSFFNDAKTNSFFNYSFSKLVHHKKNYQRKAAVYIEVINYLDTSKVK